MSKTGVTLYFVRHGETYLNFYERIQGWSNAPLTDRGVIDVRRSGRGLKDVKFDAVYTSDLSRTVDTAELILEENEVTDPYQEIILMPEFREVFFGSFEGEKAEVLYDKIAREVGFNSGEEMLRDLPQFERMKVTKDIDPNGHAEDFMEFWTRAQKGLIEVINNHRDTGDNVLIVAHGATIRILLENLVPELQKPGMLDNASVSIAHYGDGMYRLDSYGDTRHFVEESDLIDK